MKTIICLPTWALAMMMWSFLPNNHTWKLGPPFTPYEWAQKATFYTLQTSIVLWIQMLSMVLSLIALWMSHHG